MNEQWEVSKEYGDEIVIAGTTHLIIELLGGQFVGEEYIIPIEVQKRAALVAAAPSLLASCEAMLTIARGLLWGECYDRGGTKFLTCFSDADTAIKKARGL